MIGMERRFWAAIATVAMAGVLAGCLPPPPPPTGVDFSVRTYCSAGDQNIKLTMVNHNAFALVVVWTISGNPHYMFPFDGAQTVGANRSYSWSGHLATATGGTVTFTYAPAAPATGTTQNRVLTYPAGDVCSPA